MLQSVHPLLPDPLSCDGAVDALGLAPVGLIPHGVCGHADGTGSVASFHFPTGITTDGINLFVSDQNMIRKIVIATGEVTTLADSGGGDGLTTDGTKIFVSGAYFINAIQ